MSLHWGAKHASVGLVSVLLVVKLLAKKVLIVVDDVFAHLFVHTPLEVAMVELPVSVLETVGGGVVSLVGSDLPPTAVGIVVVYPLMTVLVTVVVEEATPRLVASYWLGATVVTSLAVAASFGLVPDPAGAGSGLAYHLEHHTLAVTARDGLLALGSAIAWVLSVTGLEVDESIGIVVACTAAAALWGVLWHRHIGHH